MKTLFEKLREIGDRAQEHDMLDARATVAQALLLMGDMIDMARADAKSHKRLVVQLQETTVALIKAHEQNLELARQRDNAAGELKTVRAKLSAVRLEREIARCEVALLSGCGGVDPKIDRAIEAIRNRAMAEMGKAVAA
jgi:hypothetical protein